MTPTSNTKADANPTKAFFVSMITRDISLEDCILDLIDNSIDAAWRSEGNKPVGLAQEANLSRYSISITATAEEFRIVDNCGGLSLDSAVEYAFSFGRRPTTEHEDYSIGVYGIGMKRAVFKLGTDIRVRSTYQHNGTRESFAVPIKVDEWVVNDTPPWDFDVINAEPLSENGVEIAVRQLTSQTASSFSNPAFIQNLRRVIARDYSIHLNRGLKIRLNDSEINGWQIQLRLSDDFVPMRYTYEDAADGNQVLVEIIGGMAAPPPESTEPTDDVDPEKRYGWYVACNGRMVVAADRSPLTGWGTDDLPQWHPQFSGFIGIVLFTAADAVALPLTTTKRSVDTSSEVYRRARPLMRDVTRLWINYTNARKAALDEAKQKENLARAVSVYRVAAQRTAKLPSLAPRSTLVVANVHYSVPIDRLKKLAAELGSITMPYRDVGLKSFDYTYADLVGED